MSMTDYEQLNPPEQGGTLERRYETIAGLDHGCHNCNNIFEISPEHIYGQAAQSHTEKIMDGDGNGWIVVLMCPECGYTVREVNWRQRIR